MSKQYTVKIKTGSYDLSTQAQLSTLEPLFKRDYYELTSWNSEPNGGGTRLDLSTNVQNDMSAYAQWKPVDYSITYKLDGGTNDSHNPATYNIESETIQLCNATKFQHVFDKWTENGSQVSAIAAGSHGDKTLSAHYTRVNVTVSYIANRPDFTRVTYKKGNTDFINIVGEITNTSIGDKPNILSCNIGHNVLSIGQVAFWGCNIMKKVAIPNTVSSIGDSAFFECFALDNVVIPSTVTSIQKNVFASCRSLQNITLPNSITSIGWGAFNDCRNLKNATIPNSVTSIGGVAFANCISLVSISIPPSVESIGQNAFYDCPNLKTVYVSTGDVERVKTLYTWPQVSFVEV